MFIASSQNIYWRVKSRGTNSKVWWLPYRKNIVMLSIFTILMVGSCMKLLICCRSRRGRYGRGSGGRWVFYGRLWREGRIRLGDGRVGATALMDRYFGDTI